ncbi:uncharacterized protein LOC128297748 [Anopheles moucheti]|uniref:uncharacterized protein LOC128297748 n=1 Tax=Anopheles moucheti TaxID=186751 RepID=UPI0022F084B6|nr:uncharacterized protein LOC128297748 [Anopheles moucheti]
MPYSVVETIGCMDSKKLLTVPETWIVCQHDAPTGFLYWPDAKNVSSLKELMANEHSTPSASWEKRICKIIYRGIPSLTSAQKTLEVLQKQYKLNICVVTRGVKKKVQHSMNPMRSTAPTLVAENQPTDNATKRVYNSMNPLEDEDPFGNHPVPKPFTENMFTFCKPKEEYDPFGDLFPATSGTNLDPEKNPSAKRQSAIDPLEDVKYSSQLYDLIYELKNIIMSIQEEMKQNIREGFNQIQETMLSPQWCNEQKVRVQSNHKLSETAELYCDGYVYTLKTAEDMKRFDDQLRNTEYRKKVISFVDLNIQHETKTRKRMKILFDMLFDGNLLDQLNWSGKNGKHGLKSYLNIRKLFEYSGSTSTHRSNQAEVTKFVMKTLENRMRARIEAQRKRASRNATVCRSKSIGSTQQKTIPNALLEAEDNGTERKDTAKEGERIERDEMIEESKGIEQDKSIENDESMEHGNDTSVLENSQTLSDEDSSQPAVSGKILTDILTGKRITCVQELDTFEEQLNDVKVKQQVQKWIEQTVGPVTDEDERMNDLLDRLIERKVLRTFSWMDANSGKLPLESYNNFVKLFEYASRSVIHHTIIFNRGYVSNFFMNCISNIERQNKSKKEL